MLGNRAEAAALGFVVAIADIEAAKIQMLPFGQGMSRDQPMPHNLYELGCTIVENYPVSTKIGQALKDEASRQGYQLAIADSWQVASESAHSFIDSDIRDGSPRGLRI
jgi:hypothetical protein